MNKTRLLMIFFLGACLALSLRPELAWNQEKRVTQMEHMEIEDPAFVDIVSDPYEVIEVNGVPGMPDARLIIKSARKGLVYLSDQGQVLRSLELGRRQVAAVSADGRVIGVLDIRGIDDGTPDRLRVETASGDLLWERDDGFGLGEKGYAPFYVTPQGYVVVSSDIHPGGMASGSITRPLIFDSKGGLVAELPARYIWNNMSITEDGLYLAISFCDLDAACEGAPSGEGDESPARASLALYEVQSGKQLWKHDFGYCGTFCIPGVVAATNGAQRIVCGGQDKMVPSGRDRSGGWFSMYVFDREGNTISHSAMKNGFGSITLSPGGRMAALAVGTGKPDSVIIVALEDGRIASSWCCVSKPICRVHVGSISDGGVMAVSVMTRGGSEDSSRWLVVSADGDILYEESMKSGFVRGLLLSGDGKLLRKVSREGATEYEIRK
jgi:hypothetical protein